MEKIIHKIHVVFSHSAICHNVQCSHNRPSEKTLAHQQISHKLPSWEADEMVIRYGETSPTHRLKHISIFHSWRQNTFEWGRDMWSIRCRTENGIIQAQWPYNLSEIIRWLELKAEREIGKILSHETKGILITVWAHEHNSKKRTR